MSAGEPLPPVGVGVGRPRGASPFADVAPTLAAVIVYALGLVVWLLAGEGLPGGRRLGVHLFTLGVLTNAILAFSEHFARSLTGVRTRPRRWWIAVANLGTVLVLTGLALGAGPSATASSLARAVLAVGSVLLVVAVVTSWVRIRWLRRAAPAVRLGWVLRRYEDAHAAFVLAAMFGLSMGVGWVPDAWYFGFRQGHLHTNVLGWGVLTLLATLVFFGPTMARAQIRPGADRRANRALGVAAPVLAGAVGLLVLSGAQAPVGPLARGAAGLSLAAVAVSATLVCVPVWQAVAAARVTAARHLLLGVVAWLMAVVWADAALVAVGRWRWLDTVGVVALAGVLAPAILATMVYLAPMLRGRTTGERELIRIRLEVGARSRAVALNLGVGAVALGGTWLAGVRVGPLSVAGAGFSMLAAVMLATLAVGLWPLALRRPRG